MTEIRRLLPLCVRRSVLPFYCSVRPLRRRLIYSYWLVFSCINLQGEGCSRPSPAHDW